MDIRLQRLETFVVHDHHGNSYTVHAYERLARVHILHDPERAWEPTGVAEYRLDNGEHLELERDGGFRVVESGLRLERHVRRPGGSENLKRQVLNQLLQYRNPGPSSV